MKKKIILSILFIFVIAIFIFVYMHNKKVSPPNKITNEYVTLLFKDSLYPLKMMIKKGSTLNDAILKLHTIDNNHYDTFLLNKEVITGGYKIFKDCIITVK